ncbi:MAG TPA: group 1 truncated hemoglobin [Rudaea sp.]|nr:group 1 truncated hemoglobin [Rudaea sp.]
MSTHSTEGSLYERIGGAEAVAAMIGSFYAKVIADPNLRPYFDRVGMDKLQHMQVEFFCSALDGPIRYAGRPVIHAHHGLGITREHFQRFVEHLFETLANYPLSEKDRYDIISRINTYADDVIGSGTGPVA